MRSISKFVATIATLTCSHIRSAGSMISVSRSMFTINIPTMDRTKVDDANTH